MTHRMHFISWSEPSNSILHPPNWQQFNSTALRLNMNIEQGWKSRTTLTSLSATYIRVNQLGWDCMQGLLLVNLLPTLFCWLCLAQYKYDGCICKAKNRHQPAERVMTVSLIAELTDCEELNGFLPYRVTGWVFKLNLSNTCTLS